MFIIIGISSTEIYKDFTNIFHDTFRESIFIYIKELYAHSHVSSKIRTGRYIANTDNITCLTQIDFKVFVAPLCGNINVSSIFIATLMEKSAGSIGCVVRIAIW